jgi:hypothetical protein
VGILYLPLLLSTVRSQMANMPDVANHDPKHDRTDGSKEENSENHRFATRLIAISKKT